MKIRTTLILLLALILTASYFLLVEERQKRNRLERIRESSKLLPYSHNEVQRFTHINLNKERIEMERCGTGWRITFPVETKGSDSAINTLLMQLVPNLKTEIITGIRSLGDFGLNPPRAASILYTGPTREPDTIYFGDKIPTGERCYVRLAGSDTVFITREITHQVVDKGLFQLRNKDLLRIDPSSIETVTLRSGDTAMRLFRDGGAWVAEDPAANVNLSAVEPNLNRLTNAVIFEFVREDTGDLASYGLDDPPYEITIRTAQDTFYVRYGDIAGKMVYATRSGLDQIFLLDARLLEIFGISGE